MATTFTARWQDALTQARHAFRAARETYHALDDALGVLRDLIDEAEESPTVDPDGVLQELDVVGEDIADDAEAWFEEINRRLLEAEGVDLP